MPSDYPDMPFDYPDMPSDADIDIVAFTVEP
jgi:hypothetical protein